MLIKIVILFLEREIDQKLTLFTPEESFIIIKKNTDLILKSYI